MTIQVLAGVAVIVKRYFDEKLHLLIGKRKNSHGERLWAFPGGHIEFFDYNMAEAGEREVFEETGITCHVFEPDEMREELFATYKIFGENKRYVTAYLVADYISGATEELTVESKEKEKCDLWHWIELSKIKELIITVEAKIWIPDLVFKYLGNSTI